MDGAGNVYIADEGNDRIRKVDSAGVITTVAGTGVRGSSGDGGPAVDARLWSPSSVAVDGAGNLFFADSGNDRIRKVGAAGTITTVAGTGEFGDGGPAVNARLYRPSDVAVDGAGNVFIADSFNDRIRKVDATGTISTVAGTGRIGFGGDGGPAVNARLYRPSGVAVDGVGNVFIADSFNDRIRKVDASGTISTVAGTGRSGFGRGGGPAVQARLSRPSGVAVDGAGNLFIADSGNNRIRKVDATGTISTVAGTGRTGFGGDGGPAVNARLSRPSGVAVDGAGNLFIADSGNDRIRKVDSAGVITTVAGTVEFGFSGDGGPAVQAQLHGPSGVAVDGAGNVYIADRDNKRIRKVDATGTIATIAGTVEFGFSGDGGPASQAQLRNPEGVAVDGADNLFIADSGNHVVRKLTPVGGSDTPPAGTESILLANFVNGNTDAFNSRVYLWNPSGSSGDVTVRVFTLPLTGGLAQELTTAPLNLGTLGAKSALNVKVAEDILAPLGITLPYTNNEGDLTLEFTIEVADVRGATQVFSSSLAFGTHPLQEIPSTSSGSPTVLVANFMNGNTDAFNSRAHLFNPSDSDGNVTVRVFTLPLSDGTAQELTGPPLDLGTLEARSALNIKLAEDILTPLGITTPYTTDGGNLTLEFTIQAADVRGAAQVFSSSFAFGVYPLQEIPSTSSGSPTVLVANFMNGNSDAFSSRAYLFNPSDSDGNVTVRVFTLPLTTGIARELTGPPLDLGTLEARSALNLKLVEDILIPLGIALPYTTDGGNLTLEFTIQAADVRGTAQVFSSSFAFGTYPLQQLPLVSVGTPTGLVANFMNGNNAAFNSRVYLWNPSESSGDVTVRVFTLPLTGGLAQELTTAPLNLGTLGAKSALNVKLVENILAPLGITLPYTTDGGNLTLEFTIQAADVRGAAQVFSSSFAFGTYPLQNVELITDGGDVPPTPLAPADEAAFNTLFVGKRAVTNYPTFYVDFVSPGRFRETEGSETSTGSYTYRNTGSNTGTLTLNYDDGDRCTVSLTFDSTTAGTASYTCNDGSSGEYNWQLVEISATGAPDLVIQTSSVSDSSPNAGGSFTLSATVRNQGNGLSTATTLRFYRSTDTTISSIDTEVGTDAVSALAAGGTSSSVLTLTAPSTAGTYYYGACVDPVSGESNSQNNCSSAVRVTVSASQMEIEGFDLDNENGSPEGIAFANNRFYVVDWFEDKVFAYQATGQRDSASDFDLDPDNDLPRGITFANNRFYVVDFTADKVYAYQASGQRDSASDFDLAGAGWPGGIAFANDRFYVVDKRDDKVYAYQSSGQRDSVSDFDLDSARGVEGITFANDRFYLVDSVDNKVYAYQATGQRDSASDFDLDSDNRFPRAITFANDRFYVVDEIDDKVYAYSADVPPLGFSESGSATRSIPENLPGGINVGIPVSAAGGDALAYSIGGVDAQSFDIVTETGQIRTKDGVVYDYETKNRYLVEVTVADDADNRESIDVTIDLLDLTPICNPAGYLRLRLNSTDRRLTARWNALPDTTGYARVLGYQTEIRRGSTGPWTDRRTFLGRNITGAVYGGLINEVGYQVRVRSVNAEGDCGWSTPVSGIPTGDLAPRDEIEHVDRFGPHPIGTDERNFRLLTPGRCRHTAAGVNLDADCNYERTSPDTGRITLEFDDPSRGSCDVTLAYSSLTAGSFIDECFDAGVNTNVPFDRSFRMPRLAPRTEDDLDPPTPETATQRAPRTQEEFDELVFGRDDFIPGLCFGSCIFGDPPEKGVARVFRFDEDESVGEYYGDYTYQRTGPDQGVVTLTMRGGGVWTFTLDFEPWGNVRATIVDSEGGTAVWPGTPHVDLALGVQPILLPIPPSWSAAIAIEADYARVESHASDIENELLKRFFPDLTNLISGDGGINYRRERAGLGRNRFAFVVSFPQLDTNQVYGGNSNRKLALNGSEWTFVVTITSNGGAEFSLTVTKEGELPLTGESFVDFTGGGIDLDEFPEELLLPDEPPQASGEDVSGVEVATAITASRIGPDDQQVLLVSAAGGNYQPGDWLEPKDGGNQRMMIVSAGPPTSVAVSVLAPRSYSSNGMALAASSPQFYAGVEAS